MNTIHHVFDVHKPPSDVFAALTTPAGLASWWSTQVEAEQAVGGKVRFTFMEGFNPVMEILRLEPASILEWRCVGGHEPWADNTFTFQLADWSGGTRVRFTQHYATELDDDSYGIYNFNWGYYMNSL